MLHEHDDVNAAIKEFEKSKRPRPYGTFASLCLRHRLAFVSLDSIK